MESLRGRTTVKMGLDETGTQTSDHGSTETIQVPMAQCPNTTEKQYSSTPHEIAYLYLEMETLLPTPLITMPPGPGQLAAPEPPDLKKYTSPFLWPKWRKTLMTLISCTVTALAGYAAGEISPASNELTAKWGITPVVYNLGITLFCIGFALAPMVLAPFSEINGRRPIFIASGVLFTGALSDRIELVRIAGS